ncbi:hypothetical protein AVEN_41534-1 [Araneus ventricosus]|uniref:SWIM-type domain-containing protein n=1 Tax=Araneus ventricosus TaxID=182803 RepID=A0A4Y2P8N7_ARAVE|nr:hypothetical protein AVEN_41534-1 [Araneus ventricosus]
MEEKDPEAEQATTFLIKSPETKEFCTYILENYVNCRGASAFCYRLQAGLNTNMHVERMHRTLKYLYIHGKKVKRLDKTVNVLMKFTRDKLFDHLLVGTKGKLTSKLKDLRTRQKNRISLSIESVIKSDSGYIVPSQSYTYETYLVQETNLDCDCQLICTDCNNVCLHQYRCNCTDACIKWNMCKHIHLVCRYKCSATIEQDDTDPVVELQEPLCIDHKIQNAFHERNILVAELSKNNSKHCNKSSLESETV